MKRFSLFITCVCWMGSAFAQSLSFADFQKSFATVANAFQNKEEQLKKEFAAKGLTYPARYLYIRSFKYDGQLEVWVKNNPTDTFTLFKTYRICALSGTVGPKRKEGDRQVPEGFYYINEFNPNSLYHLSLGLNYPNDADRLLSDKENPGGDIYIHGSCMTIGCIPLTDSLIEELYVLAVNARNAGQDFIPVHIFPLRFKNRTSLDYLGSVSQSNNEIQRFWLNLKSAYDYFEKHHKLPIVMIDPKGDYIL